jgi:hypothetical protein
LPHLRYEEVNESTDQFAVEFVFFKKHGNFERTAIIIKPSRAGFAQGVQNLLIGKPGKAMEYNSLLTDGARGMEGWKSGNHKNDIFRG